MAKKKTKKKAKPAAKASAAKSKRSPTIHMKLSTYKVIALLIEGEKSDSDIARDMDASRQWIGEVKMKARKAGIFAAVKRQTNAAKKKKK